MRAVGFRAFGGPEVLEVVELLDGLQILREPRRLEFRIVAAQIVAVERGAGIHAA